MHDLSKLNPLPKGLKCKNCGANASMFYANYSFKKGVPSRPVFGEFCSSGCLYDYKNLRNNMYKK